MFPIIHTVRTSHSSSILGRNQQKEGFPPKSTLGWYTMIEETESDSLILNPHLLPLLLLCKGNSRVALLAHLPVAEKYDSKDQILKQTKYRRHYGLP